jgi:hypothetical protein
MRSIAILSLLASALVAFAAPAEAAPKRENGQLVRVSGVVTDARGEPLSDVKVVLEGSRAYFNLRRFARDEKGHRRLTTTTNGRGQFEMDWTWDDYFNHFTLGVAVPLRESGGSQLRFLQKVEVTRKLTDSNPVVAALTVEDTGFLDSFRTFLSNLDSADEHRVYEQNGHPDEVKITRYPNHTESAWWYFDSGRVYRFRDGRLTETGTFDPVERF